MRTLPITAARGFLACMLLLPSVLTPGPGDSASASYPGRQAFLSSIPGIDRIWAVDDGIKVLQDDLDHPAAAGIENPVWDGDTVRLFGGRNEMVAFQVILQSGESGAAGLNLEVSDLLNGEDRIPGSAHGPEDPYDYRGRYVELLSAHYLEITERSTGGNSWTTLARPATDYTGWVPDALIPLSATGMGGAPFNLEPLQNQAVWVDIWIPRNAKPGIYSGSVRVTSDSEEELLPIELQVYGFTLPDQSHLPNIFAFSPAHLLRRFNLEVDTYAYYEIEARFHQMAHRHRFDLVRDVSSLKKMEEFHILYLDGSLYTPVYNYDGPGAGVGNSSFTIGLYGMVPLEYGGSWENTSQEKWWAGSDAWALWFEQYAPDVAISKYYFPDEPETSGDFRKIRKQGDWTHSNPGPGASIPGYVTNPVSERLGGYVDFWSTAAAWAHPGLSPGTNTDLLALELEAGNQWAFYNGYRPISGTQVIDADAVEFRVIPWIVWKYDVDQYFYWMTNYWTQWETNKSTNVFVEPQTMEYQRMGAGTFFYPGRDMLYPSQDRGLDGPLSSIRMKNWRRGAQDFEYLYLASSLGLDEEVSRLVNELVPAALWEADLNRNIPWPDSGFGFELVRRQLAELIQEATDSSSLTVQSIEEYESELFAYSGQNSSGLGTALTVSPEAVEEQPPEEQGYFSDIPDDISLKAQIETLHEQGYLTACDYQSARFCPDAPFTWLDMAVLSLRVMYGPDFVPPAVENFLINGMDVDTYGAYWFEQYYRDGFLEQSLPQGAWIDPSANLMRMEAAALLLQLSNRTGNAQPGSTSEFADVPQEAWYRDALAAAYDEGLLSPCLSKDVIYLCPQEPLTRAEAAAAVYRILGSSPVQDE